ncbi:hypothetical protein HMPREF0083_02051 [Aneurinibacillus aneurinilyticus ATCC 12856]|uniref:Uncharacterized protein n=1 Tax=Aneurinibacillus aneurinilyticus ATCC 12856 TaxID=649747 RepID=U1YCR2_ANEAE|nr:hypothetical protein HMPREF0083_02051 [Aneurinibacillus aneurinilyticus ATCC 12856]
MEDVGYEVKNGTVMVHAARSKSIGFLINISPVFEIPIAIVIPKT